MFDSRPDTYAHIAQVRGLMLGAVEDLLRRAHRHDDTKLEEPELSTFDRVTPLLADLEPGSEEYEAARASMGEALEHHYAAHRHHPEHFRGGIGQMNLIDLLEMVCDWIAASRRHDTGRTDVDALANSIDIARDRFGIDDEMAGLLLRTGDYLLKREVGA